MGAANLSTAAEWEFLAPITPPDTTTVADGTEVPLVVGDGIGGMPPDVLPDGDIAWTAGDGDGGYIGTGAGIAEGTLNFRVGNWIDEEGLDEYNMDSDYEGLAAQQGLYPAFYQWTRRGIHGRDLL